MVKSLRFAFSLCGLLFVLSPAGEAAFHVMQIEEIIGGINGDPTAQAIQLRLRAASAEGLSNEEQRTRIADRHRISIDVRWLF